MTKDIGSFERETIHRLATEVARFWVISHWLAHKELPTEAVYWAYAGAGSFDWGDPHDMPPSERPMHGKRVRITFTIEEY